ncbi:hypothetical protein PXH80_33775, partial [Mycolicibacterium smegmatis]|nr:hypothetical protein [Mycolicibacterium smegmatis]
VGERHHAPDDGLEPSRPYPSGEVGETCAVRFDEEVQCPSVARRVGMEWVGETTKYYGLSLQVYRLRKADLDLPEPGCASRT